MLLRETFKQVYCRFNLDYFVWGGGKWEGFEQVYCPILSYKANKMFLSP